MGDLICNDDQRRAAVRKYTGVEGKRELNGLDYLEVGDDQVTLTVYFLGKLPTDLQANPQAVAKNIQIEGGRRIRDIKIVDVEPHSNKDPELDDYMIVRVDKPGDFSTYSLRLVGLSDIDRRYDHVDFSFKVNCPSDLDCLAEDPCPPPQLDEPEINYLAKDYASFRQLILDRLALIMPDWQERHVPDLGIALVEVLAYAGDYLSYYQDAVATEAYLDTARQRVSVRRHARLVDYLVHEGCNARTWVCVDTDRDLDSLGPHDFYFVTGLNTALAAHQTMLSEDDLRAIPAETYEVFEPLVSGHTGKIMLRAAHSTLHFYTWGERECCLPQGATSATLSDEWVIQGESKPTSTEQTPPAKQPPALDPAKLARQLALKAGDVLVFEEVLSPTTGIGDDADRTRRHAVRLIRVQTDEDLVITQSLKIGETHHTLPTPVVEIEWAWADRLPFSFCLSAIGPAPKCEYIEHISVARGNVVLVDHGRTIRPPEPLGQVPVISSQMQCRCRGNAGDVTLGPGCFHPHLAKTPLTFSQPLPAESVTEQSLAPALQLLQQDERAALPSATLTSIPPAPDGMEPLFTLEDVDDPTALVKRMQDPANRRAGYLRRMLSGELQKQPAKGGEPSGELINAVRKELQSFLWHWASRYDLLESQADDRHFVVEIDNEGVAHLRFGDGELGHQAAAGATFYATYRVGNGIRGNVGAEAVSHLVLRNTLLSGVSLHVRNPLPAQGGKDAESLSEVKLFAPSAFRKTIERAIIAEDYAVLAERNPKVQNAAATLSWTGSWYEADVAVDPFGGDSDAGLIKTVESALYPYRRISHDLRVHPLHYVSLDIALKVCVLPGYLRGHVKAALLDVFSNRVLPTGRTPSGLGFFHPDNLTFGEGIYLSKIVAAAQAVPGVESVQVTRLQRQFEAPNDELANGVLPLGPLEVARLNNDPSFPEHGRLELELLGGR